MDIHKNYGGDFSTDGTFKLKKSQQSDISTRPVKSVYDSTKSIGYLRPNT